MLTAEITINAPPQVIRDIFFDFNNLSQWHDKSFFSEIEITTPGKTNGAQLVKGDKVKIVIPGGTFPGVIEKTEPNHFSWIGSIPYIFTGQHHFEFISTPSNPDQTVFRQSEAFTGLLAFTMSFFSAKTKAGWDRVNSDLKVAAEERYARQRAGQ